MKIEVEVDEKTLDWVIQSLDNNLYNGFSSDIDSRKINLIDYLESKQNEN